MKYIFLVVLVAMASLTFAKADGFRFERLDISYAGCIARNSVIIAYGTGGTMTLSYDDGTHWTRKAVAGDNERILKIANEANTFAGYTDLGKIIISTDNALTWKILDLSPYLMPIADIIICNQQLCIAAGTSLYFLDQMLNIQDSITQSAGDSIVTLSYGNGVIYAGGNGGMLWIYDPVSHTRIRTIDLKEYGLCMPCTAPSNITAVGDDTYLLLGSYILRSTDTGTTWQPIIVSTGRFVVGESGLFVSSTEAVEPSRLYFIPVTDKLENGVLVRQTLDTTERYINFTFFTNTALKGRDTIIGVGYNNTILLSPNAGKTWKTISNLESPPYSVSWLDENTGFNLTRQNGRIYRTTDGGTTWLPQFYNPNVDNNPMVLSQICFDRSGFGVVQKRYMTAAWDTIFYSTDLGDTYKPFPRSMSPLGDNTSSTLFKFDTTITLITTYTTYKLGHLVYQFDTTLRRRSYTVLDSVFIFSIWRSGDTLWSWRVNYRRPISFQLTFSLDRGNNWQIAQEYLNDRVAPNSFVAGNLDNLLFQPIGKYLVCGRDEGYWKKETNIYIYDTETRRWLDDTLNIPGGWLGGSINRIGNKVVLKHGYWDVIGAQILYGDSPVSPQKWKTATYPGTTCGINSSFEDSDIAYCIVVSNNTKHLYKVMVDTSSLTSVNEPKIEGEPTLVYAFPPYPNPASRSVRALIYWDKRIPFGTASCEIYNALGEPIERGERIAIQYTNDYHGELVWDCSQVTAGAYYILIRHGSATTVVPVLVQHE